MLFKLLKKEGFTQFGVMCVQSMLLLLALVPQILGRLQGTTSIAASARRLLLGEDSADIGSSSLSLADRFIVRNPTNGQLELDGTHETVRFSSFNAPALFDNTAFEIRDTMQTISGFGPVPVTRTYPLKIWSRNIPRPQAHIQGWSEVENDFVYNEAAFSQLDYVVAQARRHNVRLIIPIINQDYGWEVQNRVGSFVDLIRLRTGFSYDRARLVDWWTNPRCRESMKKIIHFLLTRRNTANELVIGEDPTILAWETGNQLNAGDFVTGERFGPAPADWTLDIANYIKGLAPQTLVMDGSYACTPKGCSYESRVLESPLVDIMSYHYYNEDDILRIPYDSAMASLHKKAFIVGEWGLFETAEQYERFLEFCQFYPVSGTLVRSLRPHSQDGGFQTYSEPYNTYAYHAPGFAPDELNKGIEPVIQWDSRELEVMNAVRKAAFAGNPITTPELGKPELFHHDSLTVSWRGVAWAHHYKIYTRRLGRERWKVYGEAYDNVNAGYTRIALVPIFHQLNCHRFYMTLTAVTAEGEEGPKAAPLECVFEPFTG